MSCIRFAFSSRVKGAMENYYTLQPVGDALTILFHLVAT